MFDQTLNQYQSCLLWGDPVKKLPCNLYLTHLLINCPSPVIISCLLVKAQCLLNSCVCLCPLLLDPLPHHCRPIGALVKLSRNQRLVVCLLVMDTPDKSLKTFDLNRPKVHTSCIGPTAQMLFHLQRTRFYAHDTKILKGVEFFVVNQTRAINEFRNSAQL